MDGRPRQERGGPGEPSDAELLRRHAEGDADAFGQLFLRHKDRLWAVALRTVGDADEAADALQEAMISAFRRAGDFRGQSAVTTWLHRIVVNAAVDRLRRRSTRSINWSGDEEALETLAARGPAGGPGPQGNSPDTAETVETRLEVDAALQMLPLQQRAALILVDMLGYPVAEVAEILGISVGTVKSRCARGRARLLPYLAHLRGETPSPPQGATPPQPRGATSNATPGLPRGATPGATPGAVPGAVPGATPDQPPAETRGQQLPERDSPDTLSAGKGNQPAAGNVSSGQEGGA